MSWFKNRILANISIGKLLLGVLTFLLSSAILLVVCCSFYFHLHAIKLDELIDKYSFPASIEPSSAKTENTDTGVPFQSFVVVKLTTWIIPETCLIDSGICKLQKPWKVKSVGSGVVIGRSENASYILTAAHVCSHVKKNVIIIREKPYTYNYSSNINVTDSFGNDHSSILIDKDIKIDVCLLLVHDSWAAPVPIAQNLPAMGDKVYNMAAPMGIFTPGMTLMFDGLYSGQDGEVSFFTIPSWPGCSGSAVINDDGQLVGMIHSMPKEFPAFALSIRLQDIQDFASKNNLVN